MPMLNDTQMIILATAATRDSGAVLPLPKSIKTDEAMVAALLKGLQKRKLIEERPMPAKGRAVVPKPMLVITSVGRAAIGAEDAAETPAEAPNTACPAGPLQSPPTAPASEMAVRPSSKLGQAVALLKRNEGATIDDLMMATGWQAHSVRGAISGSLKKKHGLAITSASEEGRGRVYRIAG